MSRSLKAHILLVVITFIWGATFVQIKDALREISPLLFNAVRMILAAAALSLLYRRKLARVPLPTLGISALIGAILWGGYSLQTSGLVHTTPTKSGLLTGVSVVLVPIFLALFWRRRINARTTFGVVLAFLGLVLLTVPAGAAGEVFSWHAVNRGDWLTLGCAVVFAFQIILLGRAMQHHDFAHVATLQMASAALLMSITVPLFENPFSTWSPRVLAAIAVTGLLGTAAAFTIQAWAQRFIPPTHTALIFMLEPVFAWMTSYVVLGERLSVRATLGAVLILVGILVAEFKDTSAEMKAEMGSEPAQP